jgi:hypothetical protein
MTRAEELLKFCNEQGWNLTETLSALAYTNIKLSLLAGLTEEELIGVFLSAVNAVNDEQGENDEAIH